MENYECLNCNSEVKFEDSNYITTCEICGWRNELNDTPAVDTIAIKAKTFDDYSCQIAYPLLEKSMLQYLPNQLRIAVETYLKDPKMFTKEMYQNIYHNILTKDISKLSERIKQLKARIEFALFFQNQKFKNHRRKI